MGDATAPPALADEEEDLTIKEKEADERANQKVNKAKGSALAKKKAAELAAKEELELAKKAMAFEAEMEANMSPEERRKAALERGQSGHEGFEGSPPTRKEGRGMHSGSWQGESLLGILERVDPTMQRCPRRCGRHGNHQSLQHHQERKGAAVQTQGEGTGTKGEEGGQGGEKEGNGYQQRRVW